MYGEEWTGRLITYGSAPKDWGEPDGVALDPRCPKCCRFMRFPKEATIVYQGMEGPFERIEPAPVCSRCGPQDPDFVCWASDLQG